MPILSAKHLRKSYGADVVLADVELTIRTGERIGVVGLNGAGKSTLARILAGREDADSGELSRRRGATIEYLDQVPRFDGAPTAREAVMAGLASWRAAVERHEGAARALATAAGDLDLLLAEQAAAAEDVERLGGWQQEHRVDSLLGSLGVERPDAPVSELSGGEQRRVALARILIARPHLALLDEPTNHLDAGTIEWLESFLEDEYQGALLLITHDRYLLDRVATRTIEVTGGQVFSYDGGYELYLAQKAERLAHAARVEQNRQNFLRRELEWLRRQPKARGTKQKARIERAEAAKAIAAPRAERSVSFEVDVTRSGKTILELRELALSLAGRRLVAGLDLFLTQGERLGVIGKNGTGKTTLLRAITGELEPEAGRVVVGANTRIAYFDQQRSDLDDEKSVFENVAGDKSRIELGGEVIEPRTYLERFGFDGQRQRQPVGSLSGGERARVALARLLRQPSNLLILDEPTNDLDVATLAAVESLLVDSGATAIVVTHDRWFLDRVATSILAFEGEGRVVRYPGSYETYRRLREEAKLAEKQRAVASAPRASSAPARAERVPAPRKLTFAEAKELEALPDAITLAEARVETLTAKLADPALYAGGGAEVQQVTAELEAARADASRLMARWEALETKQAGG
ncbi:MAG: ABC-F family ATP-binding cassette domain-containing protein [Sorangiineae bacterium]|nr:ABC-F family ATP-binding cassette domain-containing protein [Polyangiaceae bacterium]MEB2324069.1 ABC-F family ATP-binding cassette domain-containing protein [Sorangiineae bacterium]